jgi:hypothetical protein
MADEPNLTPDPTVPPPGDPPPANPAPNSAGGERTFTQAEVNRIVADRLARANQRQPAEPPRPAPQPQPPKSDPPPNGNGQDVLAILALRDAFDDATSDLPLTGQQKRFVRELVMKERPADVADYVSNFVTLSGWNAKPTTPPGNGTPPSQPANPASPVIPVTSRGTPPNAATPTEDTPILSMSKADQLALGERDPIGFANRLLKELNRDKTKVRPRLL